MAADLGVLCPTYTVQLRDGEPVPLVAADGRSAAELACFLAHVAGVPPWSVLYLDVDRGHARATPEYFTAWIEAVIAHDFTPAFCGSSAVVARLLELGIDGAAWRGREARPWAR